MGYEELVIVESNLFKSFYESLISSIHPSHIHSRPIVHS